MDFEPLRQPFDLTLRLPGSKSHANRAIVAACLARGRTVIRDATPCDDVRALVVNLQRLGFRLDWFDEAEGFLTVDGGLPSPSTTAPSAVELDCGLGGTTLRFLAAVAALVPGDWIVTGDARLQERPIGDLTRALRQLGVDVDDRDGCPPLRVRGGLRRGGTVSLDGSKSSQFLTALLLIGGALEGGLRIELTTPLTSPPYADLTTRLLDTFCIEVTTSTDGATWSVPGDGLRTSGDVVVEGDWSAAGTWLALAEVTRSRFRASNLLPQSAQADRLMPVQLGWLRGSGDEVSIDVTDTPDQTMNLAVVAALRDGTTRICGASNLRGKECDRLAVTTSELRKAGVDIDETEDGLVIRGPTRLRPATLACHGDHRMAMAFAILGAVAPGISIDDPSCVTKSYPGFFHDLNVAHHSRRCVALVGMRGSGKSTLAPALAAELGLDHVDTDAHITALHGDIRGLVERSGWDAFRAIEAGVLADSLAPGRIVALGGGALETPGNIDLVRNHALVVWVREDVATLISRLTGDARPKLTDLPLADELQSVLDRREPIWASIASLTLPGGGSVEERVRTIADWIRAPLRRGADE